MNQINATHDNKSELLPLDVASSEVIFAAFFDPEISSSLPVEFMPVSARNCSIDFCWSTTVLKWESCKAGAEAAIFRLYVDVEINDYDRLLLSLSMPQEISFRLRLAVDNKVFDVDGEHHGEGSRMEVEVPVSGKRLTGVFIHFSSEKDTYQPISLSWYGLQKSHIAEMISDSQPLYSSDWKGLIKPVQDWGEIVFEHRLLFGEEDLFYLRDKKNLPVWNDHFEYLEKKALLFMERIPEEDIAEFLPFNDKRYLRKRELDKIPFYFEALVIGFVGIINNDTGMMKHALRYLMSMIHTTHWTQSSESRLNGSTWDQRCFLEEMTSTSVSILTDWFSFALTERAKNLICKSLWDKGLSIIERDIMRYGYLQHMNQGAVFCRARILGGIILENRWPEMHGYADNAYECMMNCLKNIVHPDGGASEGVAYFCQTMHAVLPAIIAYQRRLSEIRDKALKNLDSRKEKIQSVLKSYLGNCEEYIRTISCCVPGTSVVDGDCRTNYINGDFIPVMAGFFPESRYQDLLSACIYSKSIYKVTGTLSNSGGIVGFIYGPDQITESKPVVPVFSNLPDSCYCSSLREDSDLSVRVFMNGGKEDAFHSHLDKGAFTLEVNGEVLLIDPGMVEYYYTQSSYLHKSSMHNVLTPVFENGSFPDQNRPLSDITISGAGNETELNMEVDLEDVWREYFIRYRRRVCSEEISHLEIVDSVETQLPGSVAFHLHSLSPFIQNKKDSALIDRGDISLSIKAPWANKTLIIQETINFEYRPVYHLVFLGEVNDYCVLKTTIDII